MNVAAIGKWLCLGRAEGKSSPEIKEGRGIAAPSLGTGSRRFFESLLDGLSLYILICMDGSVGVEKKNRPHFGRLLEDHHWMDVTSSRSSKGA